MSFRKIDVDALDEELLSKEELFIFSNGVANGPTLESVKSKAIDVRNALTRLVTPGFFVGRGDTATALSIALDNPPYGLDNDEAKAQNTRNVLDVLSSVKASDILGHVKALSSDQQLVLMKYIYKGMATPETGQSAVLLNWHDKLTEVAGVGCIVRVITDRKTV
ncbi:10024_t:CDS:2 [Paraglomus occultum]|uniref:Actin-related protein 2/3 complex subunit 5 n=1 Tax=Paraglomus occultum TaxID=144539 RepID=A0A9N9AP30_9GLOM|nr:10024_t:CDS:2 [Paraglomus occultum]